MVRASPINTGATGRSHLSLLHGGVEEESQEEEGEQQLPPSLSHLPSV